MGDRKLHTMHLSATLNGFGHHPAAWLASNKAVENELSLSYYRELAEAVEQALFDLLLIDDLPGFRDYDKEQLTRIPSVRPEAVALVSALIPFTEKVGLATTVALPNNEPYHVARKFASIDLLSYGRAAWSVAIEYPKMINRHYGLNDWPDGDESSERAKEFIDVVRKLWDSWEDDALIIDKISGNYADPSKYHPLNHKGKHYIVKGALNTKRPPQGYPVLISDGHSAHYSPFEEEHADVLLTSHATIGESQLFYHKLHSKKSSNPAKILLNITPYLGRTSLEAEAYKASLDAALPNYSGIIGGLSVRESVPIIGSAVEIADQLELWFNEYGCDGFNLVPAVLPDNLHTFSQEVIPELQRRGLFRTSYAGKTLREHLGIAVPDNQFVIQKV